MDAGASLRQCVVVSNALAYRTPYYLGYKLQKYGRGAANTYVTRRLQNKLILIHAMRSPVSLRYRFRRVSARFYL